MPLLTLDFPPGRSAISAGLSPTVLGAPSSRSSQRLWKPFSLTPADRPLPRAQPRAVWFRPILFSRRQTVFSRRIYGCSKSMKLYQYGLDVAIERRLLADFRRWMHSHIYRSQTGMANLTLPAKVRILLQDLAGLCQDGPDRLQSGAGASQRVGNKNSLSYKVMCHLFLGEEARAKLFRRSWAPRRSSLCRI